MSWKHPHLWGSGVSELPRTPSNGWKEWKVQVSPWPPPTADHLSTAVSGTIASFPFLPWPPPTSRDAPLPWLGCGRSLSEAQSLCVCVCVCQYYINVLLWLSSWEKLEWKIKISLWWIYKYSIWSAGKRLSNILLIIRLFNSCGLLFQATSKILILSFIRKKH